MASNSSSSSSSSSSVSGSTSRTMIRTDGGTVEVSGAAGVLEVLDTHPAEGWDASVDQPDEQHLEVTFETTGRTAVVSVVLSESGIDSSTHTSSTG